MCTSLITCNGRIPLNKVSQPLSYTNEGLMDSIWHTISQVMSFFFFFKSILVYLKCSDIHISLKGGQRGAGQLTKTWVQNILSWSLKGTYLVKLDSV